MATATAYCQDTGFDRAGQKRMTTNLGGTPILDWQQASDLVAYQDGRPVERLHTDVDSIYTAIRHRLHRHGPLDVGDENGAVIGSLRLDEAGRLRLEKNV